MSAGRGVLATGIAMLIAAALIPLAILDSGFNSFQGAIESFWLVVVVAPILFIAGLVLTIAGASSSREERASRRPGSSLGSLGAWVLGLGVLLVFLNEVTPLSLLDDSGGLFVIAGLGLLIVDMVRGEQEEPPPAPGQHGPNADPATAEPAAGDTEPTRTVRCPSCGELAAWEASYCEACGESLGAGPGAGAE